MGVTFEVDTASWQLLAVNGDALPSCNMCGQCCIEARPECVTENLVAEGPACVARDCEAKRHKIAHG